MISDPPREESHLGPGSRIGKYVLEQQIGHGGMAVVFRARDEQLGRPVALKIMAASLAADPEFRERFIRESRAAAAVDEPHIIPMFEAGESAGVLFIAMRYVAGGDVRSLLAREGVLSVAETAAILVAVGSALDAAHAAGLVHRDVKPANMLMDVRNGRPGHVYLVDFGLTKATAGSATLTRSGIFLGTADYAAPEQIGGRRIDGRADQYALACAAVEMLTGQPPFPFDQVIDVLTAHTHQPPSPLSARRLGLPDALDAIVGRALAKSPDDRYRTCGEFSAAFQRAARIGQNDDLALPATLYPAATRETADVDGGGPGAVRNEPAITRPLVQPNAAESAGRTGAARRRRGSGRWVLGAAAAALVAAGVGSYLALAQTGRALGAGSGHRAAAHAPSTPRWRPYTDPSGFSVNLPAGWGVASNAPGERDFTGSPQGFTVVVAWTDTPKSDTLADWQQQAQAKAATDPGYRLISISRVTYRRYNAADWQFTDLYQDTGSRYQYLDRGFIVRQGQLAYAIELYGPASQWPAEYARIWQGLVTSFRPAP
jgi:serine/threonine-protein kinase